MINDTQLLELIQSLSLQEKTALCSGATAWATKANPEKGIPQLLMSDGPHGVRFEDYKNRKAHQSTNRPATCFPPECTLAASWSPDLTRQAGSAIADECLHYGVGVLLGPGVNIKRSPLGGRNFEYYSEDPLLSGELAAGFIQGLQDKGVGASLKHFAVNSQEKYRMMINAVVDDRALYDIYLKPFEIAIKKAKPATVMASYNRLNGTYATENRQLLTNILRLKFGFTGAVMSDWGAVDSRPKALEAGLDLEMPTSYGLNDYEIELAVQSGMISEDALDTACWNLLRLIFTYAKDTTVRPPCHFEANHKTAVQALEKSAVLLKNDGMLPLQKQDSIAVIGEMAWAPRYQGSGSSIINPRNLVSFTQALNMAGHPHSYAPGYRGSHTSPQLLQAAVKAAKEAEKVLLFLGLPDTYECEGFDRTHLALPEDHVLLLETVRAANPNVCVVLSCGAPVITPWLEQVRALLCLYLGGEGIGEATLNLLYGDANPSGKLPESWPLALADTSAYNSFPMGPNEVTYNESIFVGYRYYNTAGIPVQFPFGYGLSYTSYEYSELELQQPLVKKDTPLQASFTLRNTGTRAGEEIVQLYVAHPSSAAFQPAHELKAFGRFALNPGESRAITLDVPYQDLGFYDTNTRSHVVEAGSYTLQIGPNSHTLPLSASFTVEGITLHPAPEFAKTSPYGNVTDNSFPPEDFATLHKHRLQGNRRPVKGEYHRTTPLGMMTDTRAGRAVLRLATFIARKSIQFSTNREANDRAARATTAELPFKNIVLNSRGFVSPAAADALLELVNGRGSWRRFIKGLFTRPPHKRRR